VLATSEPSSILQIKEAQACIISWTEITYCGAAKGRLCRCDFNYGGGKRKCAVCFSRSKLTRSAPGSLPAWRGLEEYYRPSSITPELAGKRSELFRQIFKAFPVAFLAHGGDPSHPRFIKELQDAAESARLQVQPVVVKDPKEFQSAFDSMARERAGAVIVQPLLPAFLY
jgi:hypothetical protein